jgi:uncharacterized protein with NRDE domain
MCLIVFAYDCHPNYRLILAANRDEFYRRPTAAAEFWPDCPQVLAGRDLEAGGTWLGVTRGGRFAALTNYRDPAAHRDGARSRGELVQAYLCGDLSPEEYLAIAGENDNLYNGYNLLVGDAAGLHYHSNRSGETLPVAAGVHGLSNHLLDTPWPKVARTKAGLEACLSTTGTEVEPLFALLADRTAATDGDLPSTGVNLDWERLLSPVFIASADYGSRSSTVLTIDRCGRVAFHERSWPDGRTRSFAFAGQPA